eukprot:6194042-Pleurochrysis_carterae.AAC.5
MSGSCGKPATTRPANGEITRSANTFDALATTSTPWMLSSVTTRSILTETSHLGRPSNRKAGK